MASSTRANSTGTLVMNVTTTEHELSVALMDGRTISVPLAWYPRLADATPEQRARWERAGAGQGIHWPELDEDLLVADLLRGIPAPKGSGEWRSQVIGTT